MGTGWAHCATPQGGIPLLMEEIGTAILFSKPHGGLEEEDWGPGSRWRRRIFWRRYSGQWPSYSNYGGGGSYITH